MVGGYATGAAAPICKDDYLVFEFDTRGRLVSSRTSAHWGHAEPERTLGEGPGPANIAAWSGDAMWLVGVDDYRKKGPMEEVEWSPGKLLLSNNGLAFQSREEFANAPPVLVLAYRDMTSVAEDRLAFFSVLAIHTHDGRALAFRVTGKSSWRGDAKRLREALDFLRSRLPPQRQ